MNILCTFSFAKSQSSAISTCVTPIQIYMYVLTLLAHSRLSQVCSYFRF